MQQLCKQGAPKTVNKKRRGSKAVRPRRTGIWLGSSEVAFFWRERASLGCREHLDAGQTGLSASKKSQACCNRASKQGLSLLPQCSSELHLQNALSILFIQHGQVQLLHGYRLHAYVLQDL